MELALLLGLAALFTSAITAAMGVGGGVVLLALMGQFVPPAMLIPLHGAAQLMSNTSRVLVQRKHICWSYIRPFAVGAALGGALLTPLALLIPPEFGQVLLGVFILVATWRASWLRLANWHPAGSGGITTGLSLVLGATGPLVMSVLPKGQWPKEVLAGTHGMAMAIQHGIKLVAFTTVGFDWAAHWPLLLAIGVATLAGNILGARLLQRIPEEYFSRILNLLLSALALRLIYQGLANLNA
ncbi:sulfite exporter TauE/SafE family protein [Limnobacter sp.]|uniref:sulfite exporter TauE/SafE family protein n=1 Tax=Limnobacter sp. TaxID=2003368 RepID=UPI003514731E